MMTTSDDTDLVRQRLVDELRQIADEIENDEIQLTEPIRYTHVWSMEWKEPPPEIELSYISENGHRTIEVY